MDINSLFPKHLNYFLAACDDCSQNPEFQFDKIFDKLQDQEQKINKEFEKLRREHRNDREKINNKISELGKQLGKQITEGFDKLIENDKTIIENQVKMILMQKFVVEQMDSIHLRLNDLKKDIKLTHLMIAYDP